MQRHEPETVLFFSESSLASAASPSDDEEFDVSEVNSVSSF